MLGVVRSLIAGLALAVAMPAEAGADFSSALVLVSDLGGGNYSFSQSGWFGGAMVTGSFSGFDSSSDGQLSSFDNEISAFSFNFSGNSRVKAFSLNFSQLFGLVYDLDGGPLGDGCGCSGEGIAAFDFPTGIYVAGPGPFDVCGEGFPCATVASVPEPANWALLIAGFGLTGAALRLRRAYRPA